MQCLLLVLSLLCASPAWATTYYVSPTGSGTTCSAGSPCTLTTVNGKVAAGDTVYLNNGTYTTTGTTDCINPGVTGFAGNVITYEAVNPCSGSTCNVTITGKLGTYLS